MNLIQRALALREGGQTMRCHTMRYFGYYDVAQHSYNALSLLLLLYPGDPSISLVKAVQWHDLPERWTGDVPTPAKMADDDLRINLATLEHQIFRALELRDLLPGLTTEERKWLDAVDLLELFMWAKEQEVYGNFTIRKMNKTIMKIFEARRSKIPLEVWDFVKTFKWERSPECHELIEEK